MRAGLMTSTVMLTIVGAPVLVGAPPPKSTPAIAEFMEGNAVTSSDVIGGGIVSGTFSARVPPTVGFKLNLSLTGLIPDTEECSLSVLAGCNPSGLGPGLLALSDFDIKVRPVLTNADSDDLPGGLTGMACSGLQSSPAIVNYTFWIGGQGHWGMNVNPRWYHANGATVVRQDRTT